jgi:hypothetical protein
MANTIFAGNSGGFGADIHNRGVVSRTGMNLIQSLQNLGSTTGPAHLSAVPRLAPLGDYGGLTPTMPPLPGSPTIDGGVATGLATDQRGASRPNGPAPDIGSVEAFPFSNLPLVDMDDDGADDRMELGYFGNLTAVTPVSDVDGDGSLDAAELGNMSNPLDPGDSLRISAFSPAPGFDPLSNPLFDVMVSTFPGLSYALQSSRTLGGFWDMPGTSFTATDRTQSLRVHLASGRDFLRARRLNGTAAFPAGAVNWWRAEGNYQDNLGSADGAPMNGLAFVPGQFGFAFDFNGVNQALHLGAAAIAPPWTTCFWVKRSDATDASAALLSDGSTALKLEQWPSTRQVGFTQFGVADYYFNYTLPAETWAHLAFVGTPGGTQLYVDGVLVATHPAVVNLPRFTLGAAGNGAIDHFKGNLDEIILYNRALESWEIQQVGDATRAP